jgi:hypothetical protein
VVQSALMGGLRQFAIRPDGELVFGEVALPLVLLFYALLLAESDYSLANSPGWIDILRSGVTLLRAGAGDSRDLPDTEILQALTGYSFLRTDQNGWIEITTDGEWK